MRAVSRLFLCCVAVVLPTVADAQRPAPAAVSASSSPPVARTSGGWEPVERAPAAEHRRPWLRNALVGAVVGGAVGYGLGRASCARCDEAAPIYAAAAVGAGAGAVAGLAITLTAREASVHTSRERREQVVRRERGHLPERTP
jgi:uncharacterized protein YcfJ